MRGRNIRHGQNRRHPSAWPFVLGGVVLAVVVSLPFIHMIFGRL